MISAIALPSRHGVSRLSFTLVLLASLLAAVPGPARAQDMSADIVDTAVSDGSFTTLATALGAAGLVDTLKGPGPFTVFAPTDEAFAKLPAGTVEGLLANPDQLRAVLTYHVVPGRVTAADVIALPAATTVQGEDVAISVDGAGVRINDATVIQPDVMASNGVIHVLDSVILPPSMTSPGRPARDGRVRRHRRHRRRGRLVLHVGDRPRRRRPGRHAQGPRPVHRLRTH